MSGVEVFELPVEESLAGLIRVFEVLVDDERGGSISVEAMVNPIRRTVELEVSLEVISSSREGWRAAVVVALGALRDRLELEGAVS